MSSFSVVQARLIAPEETRQYLWQLMAEPYSQLVKAHLDYLSSHPDFEIWLSELQIPASVINEFAKTCKTQSPYQDLPERFRKSAATLVRTMYASWFALKRNKCYSLRGKKRFFSLLKSDEQLQRESGYDLEILAAKAQELLKQVEQQLQKQWQEEGSDPLNDEDRFWAVTNSLYGAYDETQSLKKQCLISYLIKNRNTIPEEPEDPEAFQVRYKAKEIQIRQLESELKGSVPKPRLLDRRQWLEALAEANSAITKVEEFQQLQIKLLQNCAQLPYPVFYATNQMYWSLNEQGRICVSFVGLKSKGIVFEIACNKRQLPCFQRFLSDYQCFKENRKEFPAGLMMLRSAHLVWKPKPKPDTSGHYDLYLHCSLDRRARSREGLEQLRALKLEETYQTIESYRRKAEESPLTKTQKQYLQRKESSLKRLQNFDIQRLNPSQNQTQPSHSSLILGVAIGWRVPVTIAVVNAETKEVLAHRAPKQLLKETHTVPAKKNGKSHRRLQEISDYDRFQAHLQDKHCKQHQRHNAQTQFGNNRLKTAKAEEYFNRLLAKAIIEVAQLYQVSYIVLPDLKHKRDILNAEIKARAELKYPGNLARQKQYKQEFRTTINQWSYKQLCDCIARKANQVGIETVTQKQPPLGKKGISFQEKARQIAFDFWKKETKNS